MKWYNKRKDSDYNIEKEDLCKSCINYAVFEYSMQPLLKVQKALDCELGIKEHLHIIECYNYIKRKP